MIPGSRIIRRAKARVESPVQGSLNPAQGHERIWPKPYEETPRAHDIGEKVGIGGSRYSVVEQVEPVMHLAVLRCVDAMGAPVAGVTLTSGDATSPIYGVSDEAGLLSVHLPAGEVNLILGDSGTVKTPEMLMPREVTFKPRSLSFKVDRDVMFLYFVDSGGLLKGEINPGTQGPVNPHPNPKSNPKPNHKGWLSRNYPGIAAVGASLAAIYLATRQPKSAAHS